MNICLVVCLTFLIKLASGILMPVDSKLKVDVSRIQALFPENSPLQCFVLFRKYNRTHTTINVNFTLKEVLDARFTFHLELQIWGDGGWKRNFVKYEEKDPCIQMFLTIGKAWEDILKSAGVERKCPIFPGFFTLKNYYIDGRNVPILISPGRMKLLITILKGKIVTLLVEIEAEITKLVEY